MAVAQLALTLTLLGEPAEFAIWNAQRLRIDPLTFVAQTLLALPTLEQFRREKANSSVATIVISPQYGIGIASSSNLPSSTSSSTQYSAHSSPTVAPIPLSSPQSSPLPNFQPPLPPPSLPRSISSRLTVNKATLPPSGTDTAIQQPLAKKYICQYPGCNKAYTNASGLLRHSRTHSGLHFIGIAFPTDTRRKVRGRLCA